PANLRGEPTVLEVPHGGSAQIELLDRAGEPIKLSAKVYADLGGNQRPAYRSTDKTYWIHALPLGKPLKFCAKRAGIHAKEEWREPALTNVQSRRLIHFTPGKDLPWVSGVLLGSAGTPQAHQSFTVTHGGQALNNERTNGNGEFKIQLPSLESGELTITCSQGGEWQDSRVSTIVGEMEKGEMMDLGPLALALRAILVSGSLACSDGGAFRGTIVVEGLEKGGKWVRLGSEGIGGGRQFRILGESHLAQLRLRFESSRHMNILITQESTHHELKEPVFFKPGTDGLIVWLDRSAWVNGSIKNRGDRKLRVRLEFSTGEAKTLGVNEEGRFSGSAPTGPVDVHVVDRSNGSILKTIYGLELEPGARNLDKRWEIRLGEGPEAK
ncbi:MAG: Ig-like domain-containing protein, partial [Planctomycetota bacterium]|nr:Ig-like domain-containing protein [Planctomycetota bacterium]